MPRDVEICPCCGQKIASYKHNFNAVLMNGLRYLEALGGTATLHDINEHSKMTASEHANFQKLQYFGIVGKCDQTYFITPKGKEFLSGKGGCPSYVITRRKVVIECGPEVNVNGELLPVQELDEWREQATVER